MQAHHPVTGKPIKIIRTDAQLSRDNRTLVWLDKSFASSEKWFRWSVLLSSPLEIGDHNPTAIVIHTDSDIQEWASLLKKIESDKCETIVFGPAAVLAKITGSRLMAYEDIYDAYPFIGEPLSPTDSINKIVVSIAHILRFNCLAWSRDNIDHATKLQLNAWMKHCSGEIIQLPKDAIADEHVPQCWLIQQYFKHNLPKRSREIWKCLENNIENPYIDRILLLNETSHADDLPKTPKIIERVIGNRLTYADVLRAIQTDLPAGSLALFSNADIHFDSTINHIWTLKLKQTRLFLALLRWEDDSTIFGPRSDSQDSWIVGKDAIDFDVVDEDFGFPFGKPGCDNAITVAMLRKKFIIANPAYSIKTHHVHASKIRNYDPRDCLYKPIYMYVEPTAIQSFNVETDMSKHFFTGGKLEKTNKSFSRNIGHVNESHCKTVCGMLKMKENLHLEITGANVWTPSPEEQKIYSFDNGAFMTPSGLVSNFKSIMVGEHAEWRAGWECVNVSTLTPTMHIPSLVSVTAPESCWKSLTDWVLFYLPTAIRIRNHVSKAGLDKPEFLVPSVPDISQFLYDCVWNERRITTVPYMDDTQYYANKLYAASPASDIMNMNIRAEDIKILRSIMRPPANVPKSKKPVIVFCVGNDICTQGWVEETCNCLFSKDKWEIVTVGDSDTHAHRREAFQSADWIIGEGSALDWMWMTTKPGVRVLELMKETAISARRIHLAGACGVNYIMCLVRKEPIEFQREHALLDVGKAVNKYGLKESIQVHAEKPVLVVPAGQAGMWDHSGDTFREMVEIWQEREYCTVQRNENTHYCWWGGIGQVLLYDRPTMRWWIDEPEHPKYQMAMFGNCPPPGPDSHILKQSVWSFWPRSPRAVEEHVKNVGVLPWSERTTDSIFLGRVENGVQQKHRCEIDWSSAVSEFSMPVGSDIPYTCSQDEYLKRIGKSKFGLCLPGYGYKCCREIEYFACGTVPIVTDKVDMKHYLVPPKEGVHFFRANSPEEVQKIVSETTAEKWNEMSHACNKWWQNYASAEGFFRLTLWRIEQCRPFFDTGIPTAFKM
jgi:hypothetical protein